LRRLISLGNLDQAQQSFGETLRLNPRYAAARHRLALILSQQGKTDQAEMQLRQALADAEAAGDGELAASIRESLEAS